MHSQRYIEATSKTRLLFLLALAAWAACTLLVMKRPLMAAIGATLFWVLVSVVSVHYWTRAVRSGQWPPKGMDVPFRMKVQELRSLNRARAYLASLLVIYAVQAALPWYAYVEQRRYFRELKTLMTPPPKLTSPQHHPPLEVP